MSPRGSAGSALPEALGGQLSRRMLAVFLAIELLDELADGIWGAATPLIRDDLRLSYAQLGLLHGVPGLFAVVLEGAMGLYADDPKWRRRLILGGGVGVAGALCWIAASTGFWGLLAALILFFPSGGAFVGLAQATLMDGDPPRHERNMARWALAGSVGSVLGPIALGAVLALGGGWRPVYVALAVAALALLALVWRHLPPANPSAHSDSALGPPTRLPGTTSVAAGPEPPLPRADRPSIRERLLGFVNLLRRPNVLRWLVLLELADLMLDVLHDHLALYFVDVAGVSEPRAAFAVGVWTGAGLLGDFLFVPRLERVSGLAHLRFSAAATLFVFPALLLAPGFGPKLVILAVLGLLRAGWYATQKAQLYSALPGRSGAVMALGSVSLVLGSLMPLALGGIAQRFGLQVTMWLLLIGPVAILVGLPRRKANQGQIECGGPSDSIGLRR